MKKSIILTILISILIFATLAYANVIRTQPVVEDAKSNSNKSLLVAAAKSSLSKVQREIAEDEAEIISDEKKLTAEIAEDRVKYRDKPAKLAEKEREYKADLEELNFDKKELQFKKDNIDLLVRIEEKRYQIHIAKRSGNSDWAVIEKLITERNALEADYERKKANALYK